VAACGSEPEPTVDQAFVADRQQSQQTERPLLHGLLEDGDRVPQQGHHSAQHAFHRLAQKALRLSPLSEMAARLDSTTEMQSQKNFQAGSLLEQVPMKRRVMQEQAIALEQVLMLVEPVGMGLE
jgi:hypothetical protein